MRRMFAAGALVACAETPEEAAEPAALGSQPVAPPTGVRHHVFEERGEGGGESYARLRGIDPAAGEDCTPSFAARHYLGAAPDTLDVHVPITSVADELPLPQDIAAGMILTLPDADPEEVPPVFLVDDTEWGWVGGTWEVVSWTPSSYEIHMTGGETCEFRDWTLLLDTCLPDAGVVTFGPRDGESLDLDVRDGAVGEGDRWPAPGGGFLCDTVHRDPE